ncbi:MAG: hypothetical protein MI717_06205, partial [Spirochaetales bacterium]|nr:hypothetical protein [Spirochaetales bacterium]
ADNIVNRYKELGKKILVPDLKYFIDWDGDGIAGNELGDPNIEKQLFFEVDTVYVPKEGGEFRVRIHSNVPYRMGKTDDSVDIPTDNILKNIQISDTTLVDNELVIKIDPTSEPFLNKNIISVFTHDKSLRSDLIIVQEGDFSNEIQNEVLKNIIQKAATAFGYSHTFEGFYSNCYEVSSSDFWFNISSHNISAGNGKVDDTWANLYFLNNDINYLQEYTGNTSAKYFNTLQTLLYYHLTVLWGAVIYSEAPIALDDYLPQTPVDEIYTNLQKKLTKCIEEFPEEKSTSFFKVSKNVSRALLAKILIHQKKYAEAKEQLEHIISSGHYELNNNREEALSSGSTEMIYAINTNDFDTHNYSQYIESGQYLPLIQYSEVL